MKRSRQTLITLQVLFLVTAAFSTIRTVPNEFVTIQSAISASQLGDTVLILPGTYYEQLNIINQTLTLAGAFLFTNDSTDRDNTIIRLPDSIANSTTTDQKSVLKIRFANVHIIGLTFRNGLGSGFMIGSYYMVVGGSIVADSSIVRMEWSNITNSSAEAGGGIFYYTVRSFLYDCRIDSCVGNSPHYNSGGGMNATCDTAIILRTLFRRNIHNYSGGGLMVGVRNYGELNYCTFLENTSDRNGGAGLLSLNQSLGFQFVRGNTFIGNTARMNTALLLQTSGNIYNRFVNNNNFINNRAFPGGEGGALTILTNQYNNWYISDNEFIGNGWNVPSSHNGGALVFQGGNYYVSRNIFLGNRGILGSLLYVRNWASVQFDSNYLGYHEGTVVIQTAGSSFTATNCDFIQNEGPIASAFGEEPLSFTNNYWGHPSGPRTAENQGGMGDSLPPRIPYIPFRTTPVFPELPVKEFGGDGNPNDRGQNGSELPNTITIENIYPNPTNSTLTVNYTINRPQLITFRLYDTNGREVYTSLPQPQIAGSHTFSLQTDGIASGLYFLKLSSTTSPTESALQKVVLLK